jgi:hypothetical protein
MFLYCFGVQGCGEHVGLRRRKKKKGKEGGEEEGSGQFSILSRILYSSPKRKKKWCMFLKSLTKEKTSNIVKGRRKTHAK